MAFSDTLYLKSSQGHWLFFSWSIDVFFTLTPGICFNKFVLEDALHFEDK